MSLIFFSRKFSPATNYVVRHSGRDIDLDEKRQLAAKIEVQKVFARIRL